MEIEEKTKIGIGTRETEKLKPAKVKVVTIDISPPRDKEGNVIKTKAGKPMDDKVTFGCKHPNKEDLIELSQVAFIKQSKVTESGLWFNLDEDKKLPKNSALSTVLRHYNAKDLSEMNGKELDTVVSESGFLIIKAY